MTTLHELTQASLADLVAESGLRRVHLLSWRDFDDADAGGSELHAAMVTKRWVEAGLDVTIRTSAAAGHGKEINRDGSRVIRKGGRYTVFPRAVVAQLAGLHGPSDGILEVWNGVPWLSPLWARVPRAIMLHHVHQNMWDMVLSKGLSHVGKAIEGRLAPPAYRRTSIVTPSPATRREVIDILGMQPERVSVASPGIDAMFNPEGARLSPTPMIVAVGRITRPKRFDEMIRIADVVRRSHPDLKLVIVGQGPERAMLEQVVRDLDATDWVRLTGRVSDAELVELYQQAWVVTSASMSEGWGMTLTEAAACGTPAVATKIMGHCDSVEDGTTGLLAANSREMVAHLDAVLRDASLRHTLAVNAQLRAERFTWEACAYGTFLPLAEAAILRRQPKRALKLAGI